MKLDPLTVPYRVAEQVVKVGVVLLFAGVPSLSRMLGVDGRLLAAGVLLAVLLVSLAYVSAYYRRFDYALTDDTMDLTSGVFVRRDREIPLRRVQNVDISQNVVQRALGIAAVDLETAGGSQSEASLRYVAVEEAERLQSEVSRLRESGAAGAESEAPDLEPVFSISSRELALLGVLSVDFRVASGLFVVASLALPSVSTAMAPDYTLVSLLGPVAGLAAVLVLGAVNGAVKAARYWGFTLRRGASELRYERGLVQRFSGTIPLEKVQTLTVSENVLARRFGFASLVIETAGYGGGGDTEGGSQSAVPLAERDRVLALARSVQSFGDLDFERPPRRARQRYAARYLLAVLAVTALLWAVTNWTGFDLRWYVPLVAVPLVPVAAHVKWANRGYVLGDDHVVTRNGFWVRTTRVVPYHRVQTVASEETVFQRRRRLGTVVVDTAGTRSLRGDDPMIVDVGADRMGDLREAVGERLTDALARRRLQEHG